MGKMKTASEIEREKLEKSFGIWLPAITGIWITAFASIMFAWASFGLWLVNADKMGKSIYEVPNPFIPYVVTWLCLSAVLFLVTLPRARKIKKAWTDLYSSKELLSPGMERVFCYGSNLNGWALKVRFEDGTKTKYYVTELLNADGSTLLEKSNYIPDRLIWGVPRNLYKMVWMTHDGKLARLRAGCAFKDTKQVEIGIQGGGQERVYFDTLRAVSVQ